MRSNIDEAGVRECQDAFDRGFIEGDAEAIGSLFAEDGEAMFDRMETVIGRDLITKALSAAFESSDFVGWTTDWFVFDVHPGHAYVIGDFDVEVHPYDSRPPVRMIGRGVLVWRQSPNGLWKITHAISARRGETLPLDL